MVLATGIGSMPQKKPPEAIGLIFKYTPSVPFWPQLPKRSIYEGMILQFSEGFSFLKSSSQGLIYDADNSQKGLEDFYSRIIDEDIDYFKITSDFAFGLYLFYERLKKLDLKNIHFIKLQITGPFTFLGSIKDEKGNFVLQDEVVMEAVAKGLTRKALWQIKFFTEFNKRIILFFDEPYLGCFGSAYTPINREQIIKTLMGVFKELKDLSIKRLNLKPEDLLIGIHCCGNTDWSIFTELPQLDIISFDAFNFGDKVSLYAKELKKFLERKGILCWGLVPTLEFDDKMDEDFLLERFNLLLDEFIKKGLDKELILESLFLSPSCGLGNVEEEKSSKILRILFNLSQKFPLN